MTVMIREALSAKAAEMRAEDSATRAEWEAETEPGYPMIPIVELSLALRGLVAAILEALSDIPRRTLMLGLLAYVAVVVAAVVWLS